MDIDYPFHIDHRGRTAQDSSSDHIRDLIEQVLFTSPGERVNRPTFGSGLMQLVFAPNSEPLAVATQATVQASLHQWVGHLIQVDAVDVEQDDSSLLVTVRFMVRRTQESQVQQFSRSL